MTYVKGFAIKLFIICFISQWMKGSKHTLFVFPPKKILIWRRHCSIGQSCCGMITSQVWSFKLSHVRLYAFNKPIKSFVVSVLFTHFHFKVILKSLYQCVLACETKDIPASVNETPGPFPRHFVIDIFNFCFKSHDALKRIFPSFLSGEHHWDKCERRGKRVACDLRWKTNKPSIKRQLGSLRKQRTFCDATTGLPTKWHLRNECRNSILMTRHFRQLGSDTSSVWNFCVHFAKSFCDEAGGGSTKCQMFTQANNGAI